MKYRITLKRELCCACAACVIGCIDQNDLDQITGGESFRQVRRLESAPNGEKAEVKYVSLSCMHCSNAPCIQACPMGCLYRDPDTGFVVYDNTKCVGCQKCFQICPIHSPRFRLSDGKMVKCNGCNERVKAGLTPACVKACPFGALVCTAVEGSPD